MKKKICVTILATATMLLMSSCGKFTCELCGAESNGKKYTISFDDEKITVCSDCYQELKEIQDAFK